MIFTAALAPGTVQGRDTGATGTTGTSAFAFDLYGRLSQTPGNLFFSPYSISTCLAMTYQGARGRTAVQMAKVLHLGANPADVAAAFGEIQRQLQDLQKNTGTELNTANALWAQEGHPFLLDFLQTARRQFEARVEQADFKTQAEPVQNEINQWVSQQTKGKIADLLQPGDLNASTRLVLVNAIYFKGHWTSQFKTNSTAEAPFRNGAAGQKQVRMMNQTAEFRYAGLEGLQVLEMPYAGGALAMMVLLPSEADGLPALESGLNADLVQQCLDALQVKKVNVFLPKYKLEARFDLNKPLRNLGMTDAFSSEADFSGMDGGRDLQISAVVHKAYVDVNEEGTEAAAATGTTMRALAVQRPEPIPIFRADHPFIFLIRDKASGTVLFLGRLADPG